jgi:cyanobactin maturation PatA/PatG family protease
MSDSAEQGTPERSSPTQQPAAVGPQVASAPAGPTLSRPRVEQPSPEAVGVTRVSPSACGCGAQNGGASLQKVFALGKLSFDYGSRSRRTYFAQAMKKAFSFDPEGPRVPDVDDPQNLYNYLTRRSESGDYTILEGRQFNARAEVSAFYWVLHVDETPIYAIVPTGPFAFEIHDTLTGFLHDQLTDGAERISVPGVIAGEVKLFYGETLPVIVPDIRGMYSWKTSVLVKAAQNEAQVSDVARKDLEEFLDRVYAQTRNLGVTSQDRAMNYAATDALRLQGIFGTVRRDSRFGGFELDTFSVAKSPVCRPDFDCWDVSVIFYDPNNLQRARRGFRFTVDVSDVIPVMVGDRKEFSLR